MGRMKRSRTGEGASHTNRDPNDKSASKVKSGDTKRRKPSETGKDTAEDPDVVLRVVDSSESEDGTSQQGDDDPLVPLSHEAVKQHEKMHDEPVDFKLWTQTTKPIADKLSTLAIELEKKRRQEVVDFENIHRQNVIDFENKRRADVKKLNTTISTLFSQLQLIYDRDVDQSPTDEAATCAMPGDFMADKLIAMLDKYESVNKGDRSKDTVVEVFQEVVSKVSQHMIENHMNETVKHRTGMSILSVFTSDMHHSTPSSGKK